VPPEAPGPLVDTPGADDQTEKVQFRWGILAVLALLLGWGTPAAAQTAATPPVKVHLTLAAHRVVAGHPIKGTVVLTNTADRAITVNTCALDGWLAVGLSGQTASQSFFHSAVGCKPSVTLAPGTRRVHIMVSTTYTTCTEAEPAGNTPSSSFPNCTVSDGRPTSPPLPAGRYSTVVQLVGLDGETRPPNRIVVTLSAPAKQPVLAPCAVVPGAATPIITVPNVVGLSSSLAALSLAHACLNAGYASPVGTRVTAEAPAAGSKVAEHSTIILTTQGTAVTVP
jgi:hypothetical protein